MVEITLAAQTEMFLQALALGGVAGIGYDIFRVLRRAVRHGSLAILLEDLLFFLLCTVLLAGFFMECGGGEVRIFAIIGMLLGWVIYYFTVGAVVIGAAQAIIDLMTRLWLAVTKPLLRVARWTAKTINNLLKPLVKQKNRLKSQMNMLYNKHICLHSAGGKGRWRCRRKEKKKKAPPSTR